MSLRVWLQSLMHLVFCCAESHTSAVNFEDMVHTDKSCRPSAPKKAPKQRHQSLPSPALCCACGLCILLAGINITLVGAFAFGTFIPTKNPPIIIGPLLLLVALAFFTACCVVSRRPLTHKAQKVKGGETWALMRMGTAAFEMEMSEYTQQDTTAVQLSSTNSHSSSHKSCSSRGGDTSPPACQDGATEPHISATFVINVPDDNPMVTSRSKGSNPTQMLPVHNVSAM